MTFPQNEKKQYVFLNKKKKNKLNSTEFFDLLSKNSVSFKDYFYSKQC